MGARSSWTRALARAAGATLVVPVGLLLAVVVAASLGGGSFGGLGQLVAGPELPVAGSGGGTARGDEAAGVARLPRGSANRDRRTSQAGSSPDRRAGARTRGRRTTRRTDGSAGTGRVPGTTSPSPSGTGTPAVTTPAAPTTREPPDRPAPVAAPAPTPAPTGPANPVRVIGDAVEDVVRPLPVAGPPVADAVGTVVDLVAPPAP